VTEHKHFLILDLQSQYSSQQPPLHQKSAKTKKGQQQTNGNRHLQGQGYVGMSKLLCMTDLHFML